MCIRDRYYGDEDFLEKPGDSRGKKNWAIVRREAGVFERFGEHEDMGVFPGPRDVAEEETCSI